jgi:hypothetical protein
MKRVSVSFIVAGLFAIGALAVPAPAFAATSGFAPPSAVLATAVSSPPAQIEEALLVPTTSGRVAPVQVAEREGPRGDHDRGFDRGGGFRGGFGFYGPYWGTFGWPGWGYWGPGYWGWGLDGGYAYNYSGGVRLKITGPNPKQADVYADGGYVGTVDDFNGVFQQLTLLPGPHTIEVRANGYKTLSFRVYIQPDTTITYRGEMQQKTA